METNGSGGAKNVLTDIGGFAFNFMIPVLAGYIGICGELAADTVLTETFLRMRIDELSVSPVCVLKIRDAVRNIDLSK